MRAPRFDSWSAFLVMLFGLVGLCGMFASYAASIPLERGMARSALLDQAASADPQRLETMRPILGSLAATVIDGQGPMPERVAKARQVVVEEQRREAASVDYRTRLMLCVITVLAALMGSAILAVTRRSAAEGRDAPPSPQA